MMDAQDLNQVGNVANDVVNNLAGSGNGGTSNSGGGGRKNFNNNRNFGGNSQVSEMFIVFTKTQTFIYSKPITDLLRVSNILLLFLRLKNT